ncbi:acyl-CoA dehydrogenase family protein [Gulosibacter sp. ACHW.36C]|uniref:Acyl-CoA/acyl-ACP dehydrogenase n=1 Tax=Gulosibacter sediminis TaxID=1729695 RepID=A0ABY4MUN2_9MICO|nr:acyl-CoA dehydrogenase family protein [Gulosibacter sediminis]UQN14133.1 acyl-CoA/acyl-ACP dehydrogenase [Gulosibacter sediminis]
MSDREARHAELAERYLPQERLERFRVRADEYDRENRFFAEDFEELRDAGYLRLFVPEELGGPGLSLNEVSRLQQRLATAAPATALGINMHLVCTGVARALFERDDRSLQFVLEDAAADEVYAFGISEAGNDWVLYSSNTEAAPQPDGGYLLTGTKIFTSLSPVWTRLITHGKDVSGAEDATIVYGVVDRSEDGISVSSHWDPMGMRATQSRSTKLDAVPLRADRVVRRLPDGLNPDSLPFAINANFQLLIASVYAGLAARALEVGAAALRGKSSAKAESSFAEIPEFRVRLADAAMQLEAVPAQLETYTREFDELVDHGRAWPRKFVSAKLNATEAARSSVEAAYRCAGGRGFDNGTELNRLYRDALAGMFHPSSWDVARPMFAAALLDD